MLNRSAIHTANIAIYVNKLCNSKKCTVRKYVPAIFPIAPTRVGAIISQSSGRRHQNFFKKCSNKLGYKQPTCFVPSKVKNIKGLVKII